MKNIVFLWKNCLFYIPFILRTVLKILTDKQIATAKHYLYIDIWVNKPERKFIHKQKINSVMDMEK